MMSDTMKLWEKIVEIRIRKERTIGDKQFRFMLVRSTIDALFAQRELLEKHRKKRI